MPELILELDPKVALAIEALSKELHENVYASLTTFTRQLLLASPDTNQGSAIIIEMARIAGGIAHSLVINTPIGVQYATQEQVEEEIIGIFMGELKMTAATLKTLPMQNGSENNANVH